MRYVLICVLFFASNKVLAFQPPERHIIDSAIIELDRALLNKDTSYLNVLLDKDIAYGHSNGWIETKRDVIDDLYNGKLTYKQINTTEKKIEVRGKVSIVRTKADVDVVVSSAPVHLKLGILQVWRLKHKRWVLIARQSVKI
jgi:hypothetical protein